MLRRRGASPTHLAHQLLIGATAGDVEAVSSLHEAIGQLVGTSPWAAADLALRLVDLTPPGTQEAGTAVSLAVSLLAWAGRCEEALGLGERFLDTSAASAALQADILLGVRRAWISCPPDRTPVRSRLDSRGSGRVHTGSGVAARVQPARRPARR